LGKAQPKKYSGAIFIRRAAMNSSSRTSRFPFTERQIRPWRALAELDRRNPRAGADVRIEATASPKGFHGFAIWLRGERSTAMNSRLRTY